MIRILVFLIIIAQAHLSYGQSAAFGVVRLAAPLLNTPDFSSVFGGKNGRSLKSDRCGQVRELEHIALPGTVFKILETLQRGTSTIYRVESDEYRAAPGIRLYLDSRFLELANDQPPQRRRVLPEREQIVAAMRRSLGSSYVWGGNLQAGVPQLAEWFYADFSPNDRGRLTLAGLDCSGLLYQATGGWTPRNTSQLITYGRPVAIKGKRAAEIAGQLEPLDLIVWNGHVIIVLDQQTVIESRLECGKPGNGGVVATPLKQRLAEIMRTRQPLDSWPGDGKQRNAFVVRRWY